VSELGTLLADTVTRLLTDMVTKELIEEAERGTWPARLWSALEEGGLTTPLVPEEGGGAGATWLDTAVVVRAAGRHAAPVPLAEAIVASALLAGAGLPVPRGPLTIAPVVPGERLALIRDGGAWRADGAVTRVPWGRAAGHVVTVVEAGGQLVVAAVATAGARVEPDRNIALEPRDRLVFSGAEAVAAPSTVAGSALETYGALVRAGQMAGALDGLLELSVRYAGERRQFGRAIGAFQAIQHNLAVLACHAAAAGTAADHAFRAADRGDAAFEVAAAKVRAGEAAGVGASIAHQVHGAIGFTYEHSLHFLTRRLWSWRAEFGGESRWAIQLGRHVTTRGADALWEELTAR
jgi:acyl-CoA dehydrogenase